LKDITSAKEAAGEAFIVEPSLDELEMLLKKIQPCS